MKADFEQLKEYAKCYSGNGNCKKCFGDWDCGGSCHDKAKMLLADVFNRFVHCCDCKHYELMTTNNQYFCNKFGGYVTENDYCSRYELKKQANQTEKGGVEQ